MDANTATAATLSSLAAGDRVWFWLCPSGDPPLLMTPLTQDPRMVQLRGLLPELPRGVFGPGSLGTDGRLTLFGAGLTEGHLRAVGGWVHAQHAAQPLLCRLRGLRLQPLTEAGRPVGALIEDASLWDGLPSPAPLPGTLSAAGAALREAAGARRWLWATRSGPGGRPLLLVAETAEALDVLVTRALQQGAEAGSGLRAIAEGGAATVAPEHAAALAAVLAAAGVTGLAVPGQADPDAILQALAPGERAAIWIGELGGELAVQVTRTSAELSGLPGAARETRGELKLRKDGRIAMRLRAPMPELMEGLAVLVAREADQRPALRRLVGARAAVVDPNGEITARYQDDALWEEIDV